MYNLLVVLMVFCMGHVCYPGLYSYVHQQCIEHHHVGQYNCQLIVENACIDLLQYNYKLWLLILFWDMFVTPIIIVMCNLFCRTQMSSQSVQLSVTCCTSTDLFWGAGARLASSLIIFSEMRINNQNNVHCAACLSRIYIANSKVYTPCS